MQGHDVRREGMPGCDIPFCTQAVAGLGVREPCCRQGDMREPCSRIHSDNTRKCQIVGADTDVTPS